MKKALKTTGKVQIERHEMVKILKEVLEFTEDLDLERVIPIDENGNPLPLHSFICYVHKVKSDEIPNKFDPPVTMQITPGFTRPNYGIGKVLREIFSTDEVFSFRDVFNDIKDQFPHLTEKRLKLYLTRPNMTGCQLEIDGNDDDGPYYWNPKGISTKNAETAQS